MNRGLQSRTAPRPRLASLAPGGAVVLLWGLAGLPGGCVTGIGPGDENGNGNSQQCASSADCAEAELCRASDCVAVPELAVELGLTHPQTQVFTPLQDGDAAPLYAGFQGLSELLVTLRVSGLASLGDANPSFEVRQTVRTADDGEVIHEFTQPRVEFTTLGADVAEAQERTIILDASPGTIDGRDVEAAISLTLEIEGRSLTAAVVRRVTLVLSQ